MRILKKVPVVLLVLLLAVISFTKLGPASTDKTTHDATIRQIDKEIDNVLKLTTGAAGASAVISLLPDDQCTPIADQLAEFSTYFLIVLSALYLEKYLVTLMGFASFSFLIPLACILWIIGYLAKRKPLKSLSYKLCLCAAVLYLMIPVSTKVSGIIYENYETSIESTIEESQRIGVSEEDPNANVVEKFTKWVESAALTVSEYVTELLTSFVDALAVMLVTSCLIPIVILLFCAWFIKNMLQIPMPMPPVMKPLLEKKKKEEPAEIPAE